MLLKVQSSLCSPFPRWHLNIDLEDEPTGRLGHGTELALGHDPGHESSLSCTTGRTISVLASKGGTNPSMVE